MSESLTGKELELLRFMKEHGFPVFHHSNLFRRDVEFGIRDYFREKTGEEIRPVKFSKLAEEVLKNLEKEGKIQPRFHDTWMIDIPEFAPVAKKEDNEGKE
ncbi:MAG: hypothetical protein GXO82_07270 [Chlorobi bacterium]|nr:hypothetical protein [Chlorobiota bacterium]